MPKRMTFRLEPDEVDELVSAIGASSRADAVRHAIDVALNVAGLSVVAAVDCDISAIAADSEDLARSGLAAAALALAREIDNVDTSASAKASCVARLRETLGDLRREAATARLERLRHATAKREPGADEKDALDDLRTRREARRTTS